MKKCRKSIVFPLLLIGVLGACNKKYNEIESTPISTMSSKRSYSFTKWPTVNNGIMEFADEGELYNYAAFLDSLTDPGNYDSFRLDANKELMEFDQDAILQEIESAQNFVSIRSVSHAAFLQANRIGWSTLDEIPEEHFIGDMILKSILNENLILKVGKKFIHIINRNLSVQVDENQSDLLAAFSSLPQEATLQDVLHIDPRHLFSSVTEVTDEGQIVTFGGNPVPLGDYYQIINLKATQEDCNQPLLTTFSNLQLFEVDPPAYPGQPVNSGQFNIDFGDGSPHYQVHSSLLDNYQIQSIVAPFTHLYNAPGIYTVHVEANADFFPSGGGSTHASRDFPITVYPSGGCGIKNKVGDEVKFIVPSNGNIASSGRIQALLWGFLGASGGGNNLRMISDTWSWKKEGGKWKQQKAEIWGDVATNRLDVNCNFVASTYGDAWASNAKHVQVHRTDLKYNWNKVNSTHGIKYNGVWYTNPMFLYNCD